jgi:peptidoglycan hydrolase CwlO-like protein
MTYQLKGNKALSGIVTSVIVATLIPVLAIAGGNTNKGANPNGKPFVEIAGTIVEVEGELSSLQDQIDSLVGRVTTVEDAQAAMALAIIDLQVENAVLQAQIDANADDVVSLEAQISTTNSAILDLEQAIADLGDADGNLQAQIDANAASVTTLALAIDTLGANLQATIDNNTALITQMQQEIDSIQANLDLYQLLVSGSCPTGQAISEINANGSVICEVIDAASSATITQYRAYANGTTQNGDVLVTATCPVGTVLTGGGFFGNFGRSRALGGWPRVVWGGNLNTTAGREYLGEVRGSQYQGQLIVQAICLAFE